VTSVDRERISQHLHRLSDTCNVYLIQDGRRGTLIDFGSGTALFSLLRSVPVTGTVSEYMPMRIGRRSTTPIPTPGHTIGSVSYLATIDG